MGYWWDGVLDVFSPLYNFISGLGDNGGDAAEALQDTVEDYSPIMWLSNPDNGPLEALGLDLPWSYIILGVVAIVALWYIFGRKSGGGTTINYITRR